MNRFARPLCLVAVAIAIVASAPTSASAVIFHTDTRLDVYAHPDARLRRMADSVAILSKAEYVSVDATTGRVTLKPKPITTRTATASSPWSGFNQICTGEPAYQNEGSLGACSGFLISPNRLVTTAACVQDSESFCDDLRIVFDHEVGAVVTRDDVFYCKRIVNRSQCDDEGRFGSALCESGDPMPDSIAVIELDRDTGRAPLILLADVLDTPLLYAGDKVATIGHTHGQRKSIDSDGEVQFKDDTYGTSGTPFGTIAHRWARFAVKTDTFRGSSGGPIIDMSTYRVAGLLHNVDQMLACTSVLSTDPSTRLEFGIYNNGYGNQKFFDAGERNNTIAEARRNPVPLRPDTYASWATQGDNAYRSLTYFSPNQRISGPWTHASDTDHDYIAIPVRKGDVVHVEISFLHSFGDIDLELLDGQKQQVALSNSVSDSEYVSTYVAKDSLVVYAHVYGYNNAVTPQYFLNITVRPKLVDLDYDGILERQQTCGGPDAITCDTGFQCSPRTGLVGALTDSATIDLNIQAGVCVPDHTCPAVPLNIDTRGLSNAGSRTWSVALPSNASSALWMVNTMSLVGGEYLDIAGSQMTGSASHDGRFDHSPSQELQSGLNRSTTEAEFSSSRSPTQGFLLKHLYWCP